MYSGLGHLTRCIALAEAFNERNIDSYFLIKTDDLDSISIFLIKEEIEKERYGFLPEGTNLIDDLEYVKDTYQKDFSFLILDHYDHNLFYQKKLKNYGIKWAQFDHLANENIIADVVINANISASKIDYKKITNAGTALCIGHKYAVIQNAFDYQAIEPDKNRILIALGGGNYPIEIQNIIRELISDKEFYFDIVTRDKQLLNLADKYSNIKLNFNPYEVLPIYKKCEIAIVAGGLTTFELAALNLPMIIVPFATNQISNAKSWDKYNFALSFEDVKDFQKVLNNIGLKMLIEELKMKFKKRQVTIDTLGGKRIVNTIINLMDLKDAN